MKAILLSTLLLAGVTGYAQTTDTTVRKDQIDLPVSNPAMNRSSTAGGPDQGGGQQVDKSDTLGKKTYCLDLRNGKLVLMDNFVMVDKTIRFKNGTRLTKEGLLTRKSGTRIQLKNGDCVTQEGIIR
ncbi:MAG TPA: DUF6799 domain-containing protein [Chitinophagales bacterium]|nr:DUF6799 domain-containing protein [Chitinophagales bacterium]